LRLGILPTGWLVVEGSATEPAGVGFEVLSPWPREFFGMLDAPLKERPLRQDLVLEASPRSLARRVGTKEGGEKFPGVVQDIAEY